MDYKIDGKYEQIMYAREASQVQRCHVLPHIGSYDIAQHSFNMLLLLKHLYPIDPPSDLIWAIIKHDMGERITGDTPAPLKVRDVTIKEKLDYFEDMVVNGVGLTNDILNHQEKIWLKGLDLLEFYFWIDEQVTMGNGRVRNERSEVIHHISNCGDWLPRQIYDIFLKAVDIDFGGVGNKGWIE